MKEQLIKIKTYTFEELSEPIKKKVRQKTLMFFKEMVRENTLFLSNGVFFEEESLNFLGLKDFEILTDVRGCN